MKEKIKKLSNRIKVLEVQRERERNRLKRIAPLVKKIYNITSQVK